MTERTGDPQKIVGYVNVKDLLALMRLSPQEPTLAIVRPLLELPDSVPIAECLERKPVAPPTVVLGAGHNEMQHRKLPI